MSAVEIRPQVAAGKTTGSRRLINHARLSRYTYVTSAKIPGSPTVVAGGATGDIAARWGRWPPAQRGIASIRQ